MTDEVKWSWYDGTLPKGPVLAWDVETDFFQTGGNNITQVAVSNGDQTVVACDLNDIRSLLESVPKTSVTHNGWWADKSWADAWLVDYEMPWGDDTMVLGYLMDENQSLSLKNLAVRYLGVPNWKDGINAELGSDEFALYNARDAAYTALLYRLFCSRLGSRMALSRDIIFPAFLALRECSRRGLYISPEAVANAENHFADKVSGLQKLMADDYGLLKPRSPKVVGEALVADGHKLGKTASGQFKTDRGTVARLKPTPLVRALREFRVADKAHGIAKRYGKIAATRDGRSHSEYTVIRTTTGRTSNSDQQMPRAELFQQFFDAPTGFVRVSADYGQIEFRTAGWLAGEQTIIQKYEENPDWDPHTWMAAIIYSKPESEVTKEERQIAKSANFGLLYMAKASTLREYVFKTTGIIMSIEESNKVHAAWHRTFPAFKGWYVRTWRTMKLYGYAESATGRRRHVVSDNLFDPPYLWKSDEELTYLEALVEDVDDEISESDDCYVADPARFYLPLVCCQPKWKRDADLRECVNAQVQGLAADIALVGIAKCNEDGLPINGFVHDSISFELSASNPVPKRQIEECMVTYPVHYLKEKFNVNFTVPLTVDIK